MWKEVRSVNTHNILEVSSRPLPEELFETLAGANGVSIERIVSWGQASPEGFWYDSDRDEWVMLLKGSASLLFEGEGDFVVLRPGDSLLIPAHRRHRVEWTQPRTETIWLAVHFPAAQKTKQTDRRDSLP
jgi:cupin 2 domain-containing protein